MTQPENHRAKPETPPGIAGPRMILLEELLQGQREVLIGHLREVYRLRLTRNGKLILTK